MSHLIPRVQIIAANAVRLPKHNSDQAVRTNLNAGYIKTGGEHSARSARNVGFFKS
jgi:hypothetical protein